MKGATYKNKHIKHMSLRELKKHGIEIYGSGGAYIERGAVIESGAKIFAPCYISAGCHICGGATVYPYTCLHGTYVANNTVIRQSTLVGAHIGKNSTVGPFSYIRGESYIGENCRIGSFVEIKASRIGCGTKIAHLAYVGDAETGSNCNIGCGVVFANYDGCKKHKSVIGNNCFIGCNCNIVAPVFVKDGAYIAAGTTLTCNLQEGDFCIGRCRESIKQNGADGRYKNG